VLQCVAVCCSVLQCVAVCCSVLPGVAGCCQCKSCDDTVSLKRGKKLSKVTLLLNFLYNITIELTFEKFHAVQQRLVEFEHTDLPEILSRFQK